MLFRVLAKGVKGMPHPPFLVSFPLMLLCFWHCHPPFSELWLKPWWCWDTLCLIQLCLFSYCEQTISSDYYTCSWHLEYTCITSQKNMMNDNCYAMDRRDVVCTSNWIIQLLVHTPCTTCTCTWTASYYMLNLRVHVI